MVFFVCEGCNETLKKNQVGKHKFQCRHSSCVSCVDCSVTFHGDDYAQHTTCISEAEKYEKSLFKGKKAKLSPQDAWISILESATSNVDDAPFELRQYLSRLGQQSNVPRNKKKFLNFAKNSLRLYNEKMLENLWNYVENFKPKDANTTTPTSAEVSDLNEAAASVVETGDANVSANSGEIKSSKKKKRNSKEDGIPVHDTDKQEISNGAPDTVDEPSAKKRKKKSLDSEVLDSSDTPVGTTDVAAGSDLKKKKKKKSKVIDGASTDTTTAAKTPGESKSIKKKSKQSEA